MTAVVNVSAYWRPATLEDALHLLERPRAVPLGGGTKLNALSLDRPVEVVDLQSLALGGIDQLDDARVRLGATSTLQEVADDERLPQVLREAARRDHPSVLRAAATVGGTVASADPDSELLAALLAHEASVTLASPHGRRAFELGALLADAALLRGRLITAVTIDPRGVASAARTGRTPADRSIVAAVARRAPDGERRLVLTGVAATPVVVADIDHLEPPADFRGSSEYRRALAVTLAARVLEAIR